MPTAIDLFTPCIPPQSQHIAYQRLLSSPAHEDARRLLNSLAQRMGNPDGRLITNFQGEGFHARLFEIACFAYLETHRFDFHREHERPDFLVSHQGTQVAFEVVTANSSLGQGEDIVFSKIADRSREEISQRCREEVPIRIGAALKKKLAKRYWTLPHCRDVPLVLVVAAFHEPGSVTYTDDVLARFLYGIDHVIAEYRGERALLQVPIERHEFEGKSLTSNFFNYANAEHVSAVLFCNQWTVPRFLRMAAMDGLPKGLTAVRRGAAMGPTCAYGCIHDYEYWLGAEGVPVESWAQGVTLFHNPSARIALPSHGLSRTSDFCMRDGKLVREVFDFHPLTSMMLMHFDAQ